MNDLLEIKLTKKQIKVLEETLMFAMQQLDDYHLTASGYDDSEVEDNMKILDSILISLDMAQ